MDAVKAAIVKAGEKTSIEDYETLRELVDGGDAKPSGDHKLNNMRDNELREFEQFLAEKGNDPGKTFAGLSRAVWKGGDNAGQACWTLSGNVDSMDLICKIQREKRELQERVKPLARHRQLAAMPQNLALAADLGWMPSPVLRFWSGSRKC